MTLLKKTIFSFLFRLAPFCFALFCFAPFLMAQSQSLSATNKELKLGVDRTEIYAPLLKGKRVALMVNQSSLSSTGQHTIDKLLSEQDQYEFKVVKLLSVEHGLRGKEEAGFGDSSHFIDPVTNLPILTLYGKTPEGKMRANPTAEQLEDIDIVIYDLQDVGVRFFTYTVSMHYLLDSLQENGKSLMIFDRPNPLGDQVYGPILKENWMSGIGIDPVPMVHGLTSGEFAKMIVGEGWLTHFDYQSFKHHRDPTYQLNSAQLTVIPMENYHHNQAYSLPIAPSPNLRTDRALALYPSLALFEATSVNSGRGSDFPFEQLGFNNERFKKNRCYFVDQSIKKGGWPQAGKTVCGEKLEQPIENIKPTMAYFVEWFRVFKENGYQTIATPEMEKHYLKHQDIFVSRPTWLAKLIGDDRFLIEIETKMENGLSNEQIQAEIEATWQKETAAFKQLKEKYRLYPTN